MTPSALARSVAALVEGEDHSSAKAGSEPLLQHGPVGLVHHVPFAWVPEKSFGSRLEQAYLNSTHAKMYLAIVSRRSDVQGHRLTFFRRTQQALTLASSANPICIDDQIWQSYRRLRRPYASCLIRPQESPDLRRSCLRTT